MRRWLFFNQSDDIRLRLGYIDTLEQQELSKGDIMQLDTVNILIIGFFTALGVLLRELRLNWDNVIFLSTLKQNVILRGYL
jgi:hypothetical protein